jgi:anaerobic selenocysteine-containing dehydrogenase
MYLSGANIVVTYPNTTKTVEALRSLDFLMVASDTMTPTAELADIVLPKTTGLEEDDIRLQPGGPLITMTQVVVPPRGEARDDLSIARGICAAMEKRGAVTTNLLPWASEDDFIEYMLGDSGVTLEQLRRDGFATYPYELENFAKFATPTGKVELYSETIASTGVDPLPNYVPPARDRADATVKSRFPLTLTTGDREKTYHHSRFRDQPWAKKISPDPRLLVHPETAKAYALADEQWVRVETPGSAGSCKLRVKVTDATPEGVVATGMGWWQPGSMAPGRGAFDININAAVTYDGPWDPISGSVDTRGIRCRLVAIEPGAAA